VVPECRTAAARAGRSEQRRNAQCPGTSGLFLSTGALQDRSHAQQQQRAQGLNLVVAAIILWNTLELARAIEELRSEGEVMPAEQLRHLSPMDWEHISLTGDYTWNFAS
jgi:Tn3 transposase DDE domain